MINLQSLPILDISMTITSSHLILIPGLGDRKWLYRLVCPMWRLRGFRTHVFAFGWEDTASNYHEKQIRLNNYVRSLDGDVYLIGASAGGMAALHALVADNGKIKGVATIATPYIYRQKLQNKFLEQAIAELATALLQIQSKSTRITSFYGVYDQVVPPNDSHLDNIHSVKRLTGSRITNITHEQLPTIGHGLTIAAVLTIFGGRIRKSFR